MKRFISTTTIRLIYLALLSFAVAACSPEESNNTTEPKPTNTTSTSTSTENTSLQTKVDVTELMQKSESWLLPANDCPADIMPDKNKETTYNPDACFLREKDCLKECREGDADACYNLALDFQSTEDDSLYIYAQALFLWSCKAGSISGCTNRAADIVALSDAPDQIKCAIDTYIKTCANDDPWGCTMYGDHLITGTGVTKDIEKATLLLKKACKYGASDPACARANELLTQATGQEGTPAIRPTVEEVIEDLVSGN